MCHEHELFFLFGHFLRIAILVFAGNLPWEYDQLNIICPVYHELGTRTRSRPDQEEKYIIYNVSRCSIVQYSTVQYSTVQYSAVK